jgi:hypothetical protein
MAREAFRWVDGEGAQTLFGERRTDARCRMGRKQLSYSLSFLDARYQPLEPWSSNWDAYMCATCNKLSKLLYKRDRQSIWNEISSYFGLPGWDEIELLKE